MSAGTDTQAESFEKFKARVQQRFLQAKLALPGMPCLHPRRTEINRKSASWRILLAEATDQDAYNVTLCAGHPRQVWRTRLTHTHQVTIKLLLQLLKWLTEKFLKIPCHQPSLLTIRLLGGEGNDQIHDEIDVCRSRKSGNIG
jgi:hypothetical protein